MFDELLDVLDGLEGEIRDASLEEIEDLCGNIVFQLLCDLCEAMKEKKC